MFSILSQRVPGLEDFGHKTETQARAIRVTSDSQSPLQTSSSFVQIGPFRLCRKKKQALASKWTGQKATDLLEGERL